MLEIVQSEWFGLVSLGVSFVSLIVAIIAYLRNRKNIRIHEAVNPLVRIYNKHKTIEEAERETKAYFNELCGAVGSYAVKKEESE